MNVLLSLIIFACFVLVTSSSILEEFQQGPKVAQSSTQPSFYFQEDLNQAQDVWDFHWLGDRAVLRNRELFVLYSASTNQLFTQPFLTDNTWTTELVSQDVYIGLPSSIGDIIVCHVSNTFNREGECSTVPNAYPNYVYFPKNKLFVFYPTTGSEFIIYHVGNNTRVPVSLPKSVTLQATNFAEYNSGIFYVDSTQRLTVGYNTITQTAYVSETPVFDSFLAVYHPRWNNQSCGIVLLIQENNANTSSGRIFHPNSGWTGFFANGPLISEQHLIAIDPRFPYIGFARATYQDVIVVNFVENTIIALPSSNTAYSYLNPPEFYCDNGFIIQQSFDPSGIDNVISYNAFLSVKNDGSWNISLTAPVPYIMYQNGVTGRIFAEYPLVTPPFRTVQVLRDGLFVSSVTTTDSQPIPKESAVIVFSDVINNVFLHNIFNESSGDFLVFPSPFPLIHDGGDNYYVMNVSSSIVTLLKMQKHSGDIMNITTSHSFSQLSPNITLLSNNPINYIVILDKISNITYFVRISDGILTKLPSAGFTLQFELPQYGAFIFTDNSSVFHFVRPGMAPNPLGANIPNKSIHDVGNGWLMVKYDFASDGACRFIYYNTASISTSYKIDDPECGLPFDSAVLLDQFIVRTGSTKTSYSALKNVTRVSNFTNVLTDPIERWNYQIVPPRTVVYTNPSVAIFYEFCNNDGDCNDNNSCTLDSCNNSLCRHTSVATSQCSTFYPCPISSPFRCIGSNACASSIAGCFQSFVESASTVDKSIF